MSVFHSHSIDYIDPVWDTMGDSERDEIVLSQAKATTIFAKRHIPFYKRHLSRFSAKDIEAISSIDEFALDIPETTKEHLSSNSFHGFIPDVNYRELDEDFGEFRNWGTGGTTGTPTTVIHSPQDYHGGSRYMASTLMYDFAERAEELKGLRVMGLYHGDHVTNHVYRRAFSALGMSTFTRPSTKLDPHSVYDLIQQAKPNCILGPPEDKTDNQTKGLTVDAIVKLDARNASTSSWRLNHNENQEFKMVLWSSMPMSNDFHSYLKHHLGVPYMASHYGNTEVFSVGATCEHFPRDFHLGFRSNLCCVKSFDGKRICRDGEKGYLLFSKTGALSKENKPIVPTGMIVLNYRSGDAGELIHLHGKKCKCGRNTPVLRNIHRFEYRESNFNFGCQAD